MFVVSEHEENMEDTIRVTPTLIRRVLPDRIEIADVPSGAAGAEGRPQLVFLLALVVALVTLVALAYLLGTKIGGWW